MQVVPLSYGVQGTGRPSRLVLIARPGRRGCATSTRLRRRSREGRARLGGGRTKLTKPGGELPNARDSAGRARTRTASRSPNSWYSSLRKAASRAVQAMFRVLVYLVVAI